jgi:glycerol kinase
MSLATSRADVVRATLEAIGPQLRDVFTAMERDLGAPLARLSVDGGATQNDLLMQWRADLLGRPVKRLKVLELSAFGAGALDGASVELVDEAKIKALLDDATEAIEPRRNPARRDSKIGAWAAAVDSVIGLRPADSIALLEENFAIF